MEEWRNIKGYENLYQISNLGRVKTLPRKNRKTKEKIMKLRKDKDGYLRLGLHKEGKQTTHQVHRLVAEAFLENPNNYECVNHKDENKQNNKIENLEWCTRAYNNTYGTRKYNNMSRNKKKVKCITTGEIFSSIKEAENAYSIHSQNICKCCKDKTKSSGKHPVTGEKLYWEYIN